MRGLKVMSLAAVLMMTVLCVASVGVTESWFSDTDSTKITVETQELRIHYSCGDVSDYWNGIGELELDLNSGTEVTFTTNYAVTLNVTGDSVSLNSLEVRVGDFSKVTVGGTVKFTLGGGGN